MGTPAKTMTTGEFSKLTGLAPAEVADLIRDGKIKARKEGGKWMIPQSQLSSKWAKAKAKPAAPKAGGTGQMAKAPASKTVAPRPQAPPAPAPVATPPEPPAAPAEASYSVPEFSAMTYLTEKGVAEWLKIGRLKGVQAESGEWRVMASNLQVPDIARLLRK